MAHWAALLEEVVGCFLALIAARLACKQCLSCTALARRHCVALHRAVRPRSASFGHGCITMCSAARRTSLMWRLTWSRCASLYCLCSTCCASPVVGAVGMACRHMEMRLPPRQLQGEPACAGHATLQWGILSTLRVAAASWCAGQAGAGACG